MSNGALDITKKIIIKQVSEQKNVTTYNKIVFKNTFSREIFFINADALVSST